MLFEHEEIPPLPATQHTHTHTNIHTHMHTVGEDWVFNGWVENGGTYWNPDR
jgi:hypothetical protein